MSPDPPSQWEQLTPQEAAQIDSVCLRFERAWKAVGPEGTIPSLANFLEGCGARERTVLAQELIALDQACRQRYGVPFRPEDYQELSPAIDPPMSDNRLKLGHNCAPLTR